MPEPQKLTRRLAARAALGLLPTILVALALQPARAEPSPVAAHRPPPVAQARHDLDVRVAVASACLPACLRSHRDRGALRAVGW
jgi:hypothetical protein